ncbi:TPA: LOW QUALITY PROTEIN: hypothetical protein N0F65_003036, partial [Lagenidium giganteum]
GPRVTHTQPWTLRKITPSARAPSFSELRLLALQYGLLFVCFGFVDNAVMILASLGGVVDDLYPRVGLQVPLLILEQIQKTSAYSQREIAKRVNRSNTVVANFLRDPARYGTAHCQGKPPVLSKRDKRRNGRAISNSGTSIARIKHDLEIDVSLITLKTFVHSTELFECCEINKAPLLKDEHKVVRAKWAEDYVDYGEK